MNLKHQLLPAIVFIVGLVAFSWLTHVYPPPFPDLGLILFVVLCLSWVQDRADR